MQGQKIESAREPLYQVVWPLGRSAPSSPVRFGAPIPDLNGKTIGELWNRHHRGDEIFTIVRQSLRQRFPDVKFVDSDVFGDLHGGDEAKVIAALPEKLRQHRVDAVISALAN